MFCMINQHTHIHTQIHIIEQPSINDKEGTPLKSLGHVTHSSNIVASYVVTHPRPHKRGDPHHIKHKTLTTDQIASSQSPTSNIQAKSPQSPSPTPSVGSPATSPTQPSTSTLSPNINSNKPYNSPRKLSRASSSHSLAYHAANEKALVVLDVDKKMTIYSLMDLTKILSWNLPDEVE